MTAAHEPSPRVPVLVHTGPGEDLVLSLAPRPAAVAAGAGTVRSKWHPAILPCSRCSHGSHRPQVAHFFSSPLADNKKKKAAGRPSFFLVPGRGLEPPRLTARASKTRVSTSFTTRAVDFYFCSAISFRYSGARIRLANSFSESISIRTSQPSFIGLSLRREGSSINELFTSMIVPETGA